MVSRFRLDFLASLARQMAFAPAGVREKQLQAAEALLLSIDPAKAYPPAYVIFKITAFRPELPPAEQATGLALQHDLGLLIEEVSLTLDDRTADRAEPVLQIEDLVQQFNVTSKTIQRWRRRGLAARRFIFPDGKRRVGFRLGVVEQFFAAHRNSLIGAVNCSQIAGQEWLTIVQHVKRLAIDARRPVDEIAARVGKIVGRSALAIEAELRKHDAENPDAALLKGRPAVTDAGAIETVLRLHADGLPLRTAATKAGLPTSSAYRIVLADRTARSIGRQIKFLDDPLYHQDDCEQVIAALVAQQPIETESLPPEMTDRRLTRGLSSELAAVCAHQVLTATQERALFLQYNFRKFQAAQARRKLDPVHVRRRDLAEIDKRLAAATDVRNRIVRANLRLAVAVAKKHVRPGVSLAELVSEGSLTLMRAAESFDTRRGNKFSTYATLALMKGYARTVGRMRSGPVLSDVLDSVADRSPCRMETVDRADRISRLLEPLDRAERAAVCRQFDLAHTAEAAGPAHSAFAERRLQKSALDKLRAQANV